MHFENSMRIPQRGRFFVLLSFFVLIDRLILFDGYLNILKGLSLESKIKLCAYPAHSLAFNDFMLNVEASI